jgi:hypothetical protein
MLALVANIHYFAHRFKAWMPVPSTGMAITNGQPQSAASAICRRAIILPT